MAPELRKVEAQATQIAENAADCWRVGVLQALLRNGMWSQLLCLSLSDMRAAPMVNLCRSPRNWLPARTWLSDISTKSAANQFQRPILSPLLE